MPTYSHMAVVLRDIIPKLRACLGRARECGLASTHVCRPYEFNLPVQETQHERQPELPAAPLPTVAAARPATRTDAPASQKSCTQKPSELINAPPQRAQRARQDDVNLLSTCCQPVVNLSEQARARP
jgi:hypothetical protein